MKIIIGEPENQRQARLKIVAARAQRDIVYAADHETKENILKENVFLDDEGKRITDFKYDWTMNEADFICYLKLVYETNKQKGFDSGNYETNFYEYEQRVHDLENKYIDMFSETVGGNVTNKIKHDLYFRKKFLGISGL